MIGDLIQSCQSFNLDDFIFQLVGALFSCPDGNPPPAHLPLQDSSHPFFHASALRSGFAILKLP